MAIVTTSAVDSRLALDVTHLLDEPFTFPTSCAYAELDRAELGERDGQGDERGRQFGRHDLYSSTAAAVLVVGLSPRRRWVSHSSSTQAYWTLRPAWSRPL